MRDEPLPTAISARSAVDLLWLVLGSLVLGMAVWWWAIWSAVQ